MIHKSDIVHVSGFRNDFERVLFGFCNFMNLTNDDCPTSDSLDVQIEVFLDEHVNIEPCYE